MEATARKCRNIHCRFLPFYQRRTLSLGRMFRRLIQIVGIDKIAHFAVSGLLVFVFGKFLPIWVASILVLVLGIAKEVYDAKMGGKIDLRDLLADLLGVAMATIVILI